jgi:hypothetical protein
MSVITRREFFQKTGTGAAVAGFLAGGGLKLHANPLGLQSGARPIRIGSGSSTTISRAC